jgi:hypothetical protein
MDFYFVLKARINIMEPITINSNSNMTSFFRFVDKRAIYRLYNFMEDGNLYLRLWKMSHTIYAANGIVGHIHWRMCE